MSEQNQGSLVAFEFVVHAPSIKCSPPKPEDEKEEEVDA